MNKTRLFKKTLLAATITLASSQALAAGFQLNAQSATGIGRANAGDAVIADNAAVMARNPAAMALFDEVELSLGFESVISEIEVKDVHVNAGLLSKDVDDTDTVGDTSIVPNIHLIVPINEKFAVGANIYSNFGTKTEFSDSYYASEYAGFTEIKSINFGLAGSYRINPQWSVGAGLDVIYGQGTMERRFGLVGSFGTVGNDSLVGESLIDVDEADGWAVGFNLGTVFELDENNRWGLSYHYSPEITAEDDDGQEITLPLPSMAEFSGYHRIEDTKFAVHYSVQWIGWGDFDEIEFRDLDPSISPVGGANGSYDKQYDWQDGWHYAIGGTYYLNSDWTLRAGYMYDTSAQDDLTSISVPDSDRQWFSAGFSYHIDDKSDVDFGFTYLMGDDVDVKEVSAGYELTGTTRADAYLFGLQYSRSF